MVDREMSDHAPEASGYDMLMRPKTMMSRTIKPFYPLARPCPVWTNPRTEYRTRDEVGRTAVTRKLDPQSGPKDPSGVGVQASFVSAVARYIIVESPTHGL